MPLTIPILKIVRGDCDRRCESQLRRSAISSRYLDSRKEESGWNVDVFNNINDDRNRLRGAAIARIEILAMRRKGTRPSSFRTILLVDIIRESPVCVAREGDAKQERKNNGLVAASRRNISSP
jgi:hypothetical protein